jgi:WD40 repeat protein
MTRIPQRSQIATHVSLLLMTVLLLTITTSAQDASQTPSEPSPTVTLTLTPMPTQPTSTPTLTPQPDATLSTIMSQRERLSPSNIVNLREFYRWPAYEEGVTSLVFTNDGDLVTTGWRPLRPYAYVQRWSIEDGSINPVGGIFRDLVADAIIPFPVQLSPNGQSFSTAGGYGAIIWDALSSRQIGSISVYYASSVVVYSDNNNYNNDVIVGGINGLVSFWTFNVPYGPGGGYDETGILPADYTFNFTPSTLVSAFQVDGEVVQVAHDQNTSFALTRSGALYMYAGGGMTKLTYEQISFPDEPLKDIGIYMVLDRNHQRVFYLQSHNGIRVYDYGNRWPVTGLIVEEGITCLALSPDGNVLVMGDTAENGTLHLYNTETFMPIGEINTGHTLTSCTFNQDGTLLALGDAEGQIALWGVSP